MKHNIVIQICEDLPNYVLGKEIRRFNLKVDKRTKMYRNCIDSYRVADYDADPIVVQFDERDFEIWFEHRYPDGVDMTDVLIRIPGYQDFQFDVPTETARGFNLDTVDAEDSWDTDVADINCLTIELVDKNQLPEVFENLWPELTKGR